MSIIRIATRYSKALLDLANEQKVLDTVYTDLVSLKAHMAENRELENLAISPIVPADKKLAAFNEIYEGKFNALTLQFIKLAIEKGREVYLTPIIDQFVKEYNAFNGKVSGTLITAVEVSDTLKDKILDSVKKKINKDITVTTEVDADIIGGYIVEFEDQLIDASVKHQLNQIAHLFSK